MNYELVYILTPKLTEDDAKKRAAEISQSIGGEVEKVAMEDFWGKRKLAYPINKFTDGYYVVLQFATEPEAVAKIEKDFRLQEEIIRFLVIKKTKLAKSKDEIKAPTDEPEKTDEARLTRRKRPVAKEEDVKPTKRSKKVKKAKTKISELGDKLDDILEKGIDD